MSPLRTPGARPTVGKGSSVAVPVGVNNSAPICVTVGVNVSGVLVEVANRFFVGAGVMLGVGVAVLSAGGIGVGVAMSRTRSPSEAQLERKTDRIKI